MKLNKKLEIVFLLVIAILFVLLFSMPKLYGFISSILAPPQEITYYKYGDFNVYIFNTTTGFVVKENITGLIIIINNIDSKDLTIISIGNSTYTIKYPIYYVEVPIVLPNGSVINGFERLYGIYIGYTTILIAVHLYPGKYIITLNDGTALSVYIR